jgi:putative tryptophan/tyrosine transport system substrate-binding protein
MAYLRRREFIGLLGGAVVAWPFRVHAQQAGRPARVGRLSPLSQGLERVMFEALRAGLAELGWIEGSNVSFELRFADGQLDRLDAAAEELVRAGVDVIVTGSNPGALAAKKATNNIPIVFVTTGDPINGGLVSSLKRPAGNLTGVTTLGVELNAKRLELLKDAFGRSRRVAVLINPGSSYTDDFRRIADETARTLSIELYAVPVQDPGGLAAAFEQIRAARVDAMMVLADIMFVTARDRVVELAATTRIPAMYPDRAFADAGGLMFYGAALPDMYRHAASYVDKILRGAKPADLPVEQPTRLTLILNLKTAKALGIEIPPMLLARADEVIE